MNALEAAALLQYAAPDLAEDASIPLEPETLALIEARQGARPHRRRGWLVRRALLAADLIGLTVAFLIAELLFGFSGGSIDEKAEFILFFLTLPAWAVAAKLYELYDFDEERAGHTTVDELTRVFHLVTVGAWLFFIGSWLTGLATPILPKLVTFWALAIALVSLGRGFARGWAQTTETYVQNTIVVGAGDVGQLIARKLRQHPEYRIRVIGFVDSEPKQFRDDLEDLPLLGPEARLPTIVRLLDVERVIIAFSGESHEKTLRVVRALKSLDVQVDLVPRLFEVVGPNVGIHAVEGLPLIGLPAAKLFPFSRLIKRVIDVVGATVGLLIASPLFAYSAWRIKRESPGPVFFRQQRLGLGMHEFTALKFRTMKVDTDESAHRDYIKATMSAAAAPNSNGLYKLDRSDAVTPFGRWLRKTSLDELPQLLNVLRGDMSLVGPRPCLAYETENFEPHHFERFMVPAGLTGLWQVTARARSTFGEALDMDVAYARNWSLGLDLRLLCKTPFQISRREATA